jgi:hypothetical protein
MNFNSKTIREAIKSTESRVKLLPGIHDNIYFEKFDLGKTQAGQDYVDVVYGQKDSSSYIYKRVWFPADEPRVKEGETKEEARSREANDALSHIVLVTDLLLAGKDADIEAKTFDEFVKKAEDKTAKVRDNQPLRIKVIYDSDGVYSDLPRFANYLERQIEGVAPKLRFTKWELENRMTPAKVVNAPKTDTIVDDLPF